MAEKEKSFWKKRWPIIALVVAVVALIVAIVIIVVQRCEKTEQPKSKTPDDLAELHVFPPVDFEDSLYVAKTIESYEDKSPKDVYYYEKDSLGMPTNTVVHETHYYPGKVKFIDGNISEGANRDGLWYAYHKNGNVQTMAHYVNGKEDGQYTVYHENGSVYYTGYYKQGIKVGEWKFYDEHERLVRTQTFDEKGKKVKK